MSGTQYSTRIVHQFPTPGWRGLLLAATIIHLLNGIAVTIAAGSLLPTYVVFPVLWILGIVRLRRGSTSGITWLGVTSFIFLLLHLPFTLPEVSNPTQLFVPTVIYNLAPLISIIAVVMPRRATIPTQSVIT